MPTPARHPNRRAAAAAALIAALRDPDAPEPAAFEPAPRRAPAAPVVVAASGCALPARPAFARRRP